MWQSWLTHYSFDHLKITGRGFKLVGRGEIVQIYFSFFPFCSFRFMLFERSLTRLCIESGSCMGYPAPLGRVINYPQSTVGVQGSVCTSGIDSLYNRTYHLSRRLKQTTLSMQHVSSNEAFGPALNKKKPYW